VKSFDLLFKQSFNEVKKSLKKLNIEHFKVYNSPNVEIINVRLINEIGDKNTVSLTIVISKLTDLHKNQ
jgi:hypothetical protein